MAKHLTDFHLPRVDKRLQYKEIFSYSIAFCIQKVNVIYINNICMHLKFCLSNGLHYFLGYGKKKTVTKSFFVCINKSIIRNYMTKKRYNRKN